MMRLPRLNTEFRWKHKLQLLAMRVMTGRPAPDVVKLHLYRYDFLGKHMGAMFQEALRGPSEWSIAHRETMAAFVSSLNQCTF